MRRRFPWPYGLILILATAGAFVLHCAGAGTGLPDSGHPSPPALSAAAEPAVAADLLPAVAPVPVTTTEPGLAADGGLGPVMAACMALAAVVARPVMLRLVRSVRHRCRTTAPPSAPTPWRTRPPVAPRPPGLGRTELCILIC